MTKARRSPWLDDRAALLVKLLDDRYDLTVTEDIARQDISGHLDYVAARMRIGRQAAKMYVTDEVINEMAGRIVDEVAERRGGVVDLDAERRRRHPR